MSRIGKQIITVPSDVTISVNAENIVTVKGKKETLTKAFNSAVSVNLEDGQATVSVKNENVKKERSFWGTYSAHLKNMVTGVTEGFKKELEINGVGYRVSMQGADLKVEAGYSHPVIFKTPEGIKISTEKNIITIEGADIEKVGQSAAQIRKIRKPEPYKGKGIKYVDEIIRRKAGKSAKAA